MNTHKKIIIRKKGNMLTAGIIFIIVLIVFFCFMRVPATADSGSYTELKRYETCLIKEGDTLIAIANENADRFSHVTSKEYMQQIMELNGMNSEHITAGQYILLPDYIGK